MKFLTRKKNRLIKEATFPDVVQHSIPYGAFSQWRSLGKAPDVSQAALVKKNWGWVYSCTKISANRAATTPLRLYAARGQGQARVSNFPTARVDGKRSIQLKAKLSKSFRLKSYADAEEYEEILDHPLLTMLQNINANENAFEAMDLTYTLLDLTGNAYWYIEKDKAGLPTQLFILRSQWVLVKPDAKNFIAGYKYGSNLSWGSSSGAIHLEPDEVIMFKYSNACDPWYGMGPVQTIAMTIEQTRLRELFMLSVLRNMGRPDLLVRYEEGELDSKERQQLEHEWNSMFKGAAQAGKVKVTDYRYAVEKVGWSPSELEGPRDEDWIMKKICGAFPVPVGLVDTTQISRAPRAGMEGADLFMAQFNTLPRITLVEEKLNEKLCPMYDEAIFVSYDNPVPKDVAAENTEDNSRILNYTMTVNEYRQKRGEEPVAWGDTPLVAMGIGPLGSEPADGTEVPDDGLIIEPVEPSENTEETEPGDPVTVSMKGGFDGSVLHGDLTGVPVKTVTRNELGQFDSRNRGKLRIAAGLSAAERSELIAIFGEKR